MKKSEYVKHLIPHEERCIHAEVVTLEGMFKLY